MDEKSVSSFDVEVINKSKIPPKRFCEYCKIE